MKNSVVVFRHFETLKNTMGVHGSSDLWQLTLEGRQQLDVAVATMRSRGNIEAVTCFSTPQALHSAQLLAEKLELPFESPLSLRPFDLGIANGLTASELETVSPESAHSLQMFRERVIDATKLKIKNSETAVRLQSRLVQWWETEGHSAVANRIVVGSSSTVLMLQNLFSGHLPAEGNYYCEYMPNGAFREWDLASHTAISGLTVSKPRDVLPSWPDVFSKRFGTDFGYVQTSVHAASWGGDCKGVCLIAPGYFGNSRQGPYGLYSRLAREIARTGLEVYTVDYLGSGESTPHARTFDSDVFSLERILEALHGRNVILIGHSMGAAVVAAIRLRRKDIFAAAIAPMVTLNSMRQALLSSEQIEELEASGHVTRRGVRIDSRSLTLASSVWDEASKSLDLVIAPSADPYDPEKIDLQGIHFSRLRLVDGTDHNFSTGDGASKLLNELLKEFKKLVIQRASLLS